MTADEVDALWAGFGNRARRVVDVALSDRFRGADATYVWLASARRVPLCTVDHEMAERGAAFCKVIPP